MAVVVTHNPGDWFEETLQSLADQDYANMSVLVLDAASDEDPTGRIARVLQDAFVRRLPRNRGYAASANEALSMVKGATYLLFCHDDVALDPDAVHVLVEEAFRSNAGVVTPKFVSWTEPDILLSMGMSADKGGALVSYVEERELDRGQHDAVKDVLVAPGGCTLVRTDLLEALHGFDAGMFAFGEDLDLCWRAWLAGARIVVVPDAKVRHLQCLLEGRRALPPSILDGRKASATRSNDAVTRGLAARGAARPVKVHRRAANQLPYAAMMLQRRHELRSVLKCYGPARRFAVLPQLFILSVAEMIVALITGRGATRRAITGAWRWNLARENRRSMRLARRQVSELRALRDRDVHRMQARGSARITAFFRRHDVHRLLERSYGARGRDRLDRSATEHVAMQTGAAGVAVSPGVALSAGSAGSVAGLGSDVAAVEVAEPAGHAGEAHGEGGGMLEHIERAEVWMAGWRAPVITWSVVVLFLVVGSRQLFGPQFPLIGQLGAFPSWTMFLRDFFTGVHVPGLGNGAASPPSFALFGLGGMLLFGAVGTLHKILVLGCLPVGVVGAYRLSRPLGSPFGRLIVAVIYFAVPLPYDALANGRWFTMVAYAAAPWLLARLAGAIAEAPFSALEHSRQGRAASASSAYGSISERDPLVARAKRWTRSRAARQVAALGVLEAVLFAFVPAISMVMILIAVALSLGSLLLGRWREAWMPLAIALGATALAAILCFPWTISFLASGSHLSMFTGFIPSALSSHDWAQLLRFQTGWLGAAPLGWAFLVAGSLPLLIGTRWRFSWAIRMWVVALVSWAVAWAASQGWLGSASPPPGMLLAPAAAAIALCAGMAWVACERDLRRYKMGWRHVASALAMVGAVAAVLPVLGASLPGRWGLPSTGYRGQLSWMSSKATAGSSRVLWIGEPRTLPLASSDLGGGVAYAVSTDAIPTVTSLWQGPSSVADRGVSRQLTLAANGLTTSLGHLLAPMSIRYVVVTTGVAPVIPGVQEPPAGQPSSEAADGEIVRVLSSQTDLRLLAGKSEGAWVFENLAWMPEHAIVPAGVAAAATGSTGSGSTATGSTATGSTGSGSTGSLPLPLAPLHGARAVLSGAAGSRSFKGRVPRGALYLSLPSASSWVLEAGNGRALVPTTAFGWASLYSLRRSEVVNLTYRAPASRIAESILEVLLWLLALVYLAKGYSPKRSRSRLAGERRRRSPGATPGQATA